MFKQLIKIIAVVGLCQHSLAYAAETYTVSNYPVNAVITLGGTVVPFKEVTLSAQLPGRIAEIAGEEGEWFKESTVLIALDDTELLAQRRAAEADWFNANAAARNAAMQYERELWSPSKNKAPGGMGIPNMFDQFFTKPARDLAGQTDESVDRRADLHNFGTQIDQTRSALLQARSRIEQIDAKLRDAVGQAPFDGVITHKLVEVGDTVQPGQPLLEFANTKYLQIKVEIPARLVTGLQVGMDNIPAKLDVPSNMPDTIPVRVAQVFPVADPQRHTVTVKFDLPTNMPIPAYPGQYAEVLINDVSVAAQTLPVIPMSAVIKRGSLSNVYVVNNNTRELRLVRIGREVDANHVSVLSGLQVGDIIEVNPQANDNSSNWSPAP